MLHMHDALDPGLTVSQASHMDPDFSINNRVTLVYGPILMTLQLKHDTAHIDNEHCTHFRLRLSVVAELSLNKVEY